METNQLIIPTITDLIQDDEMALKDKRLAGISENGEEVVNGAVVLGFEIGFRKAVSLMNGISETPKVFDIEGYFSNNFFVVTKIL